MAKLPKTDHPTFEVIIPSTKAKVIFRPFVAKEEKILLIGQQSGSESDLVRAIDQVITNCLISEYDLDTLTTFDFDYVFIKLRAQSVNNMIKIKYFDKDDNKDYDIEIDLNEIEVVVPEIDNKISIGDITIELQYPTRAQMKDVLDQTEAAQNKAVEEGTDMLTEIEIGDMLLRKCIKRIYDSETVYDEYTDVELQEFLDNLSSKTNNALQKFIDSIPEITHVVTYTDSKQQVKEVTLRGINDFFTFR